MRFTWNKSDLFFGLMQAIGLLCAFCQWLIDPQVENLNCVALVVLSSSLVIQYLWRSRSPIEHPLSSLALLGMCVTTQYAALVAQTLGWTSFTALLRWPQTTFLVLGSVQLLAVGTHWVYRHLAVTQAISDFTAHKVLSPLGALSIPPINTLWTMTAIGLVSMATAGGTATGDAGGKALQAFSFLAYMPFLILIYHRRLGDAYCDIKKHGPLILAYVGILILVAMARNGRQLMAIGPVQAALIFLVYFLQDPTPITGRTIRRLAALTIAVSIAIVLFADLAVAMVINRDKVAILKPRELIEETIQTLADRTRLRQYRQAAQDGAELNRYDEAYLDNPVIARFSETKFHDNNIEIATRTTESERRAIWQLTEDKVLAILPQPVLDAMGLKVDKNELMFTFADYNRYLTEGPDGTLGGYATGSVWGHIIALFGLAWAPMVVVLMLLPSYVILDGFSRRGHGFDIAPMAMCSTWVIFIYGLGGDSLVYNIGFYLRDFPQRLAIYLVVYAGVRYTLMLFHRPAHA
ncbi:MAG: hypothetical protein EOP36_08815 [Rubrivivax sp.]|nr:MAG: hypothetical protein EOP36_08815 [Rubrivivax sp.]